MQRLTLPIVSFVFATALSGAVTLGFWKMGMASAPTQVAQQR